MNTQTNLFDVDIVGLKTLGEVMALIERIPMKNTRRRDLASAINRFCQMTLQSPTHAPADVGLIREKLAGLNPAAHRISGKSLSNIIASLKAALAFAGVIDAVKPGTWKTDPAWRALLERGGLPKRFHAGLASFANYCAVHGIIPSEVTDATVLAYHAWLMTRTIDEDPDARARRVPRLVSEARAQFDDWPIGPLSDVSIGLQPKKTGWLELPEIFRSDVEAWIASRQNPDPFDEADDRPARPIGKGTARLHREHLRLAWHILNEAGNPPSNLTELVAPERVKTVLRHYHDEAGGKPCSFAETTAVIIKSVARYHVRVGLEHQAQLKRIASKLPATPHDLTEKNKTLIRFFDDERNVARLLGLPDLLMREAMRRIEAGERFAEVPAQAAIAIAILIAAPMRSQNLIALVSRAHLFESDGKNAKMRIIIPKAETKTGKQDLVFNLDADTSGLIRFYRTRILPLLGADPNGPLFVGSSGKTLGQASLAGTITKAIRTHLGIHMTPHQFRHLAAAIYLKAHPEDIETVRQLLGHAWTKTTMVYAGLSGERSSRAWQDVLLEHHDRLKGKGATLNGRKPKPQPPKGRR
jgi:integrase